MAISMLKIRRPLGRLIFNMGIAIPGKTVFLIETAPWGPSCECEGGLEGVNSAWPGARPTNDISIQFEFWPKFAVLRFILYSTNHNESLHTSRQCNCRDVCKILLWSVKYILN